LGKTPTCLVWRWRAKEDFKQADAIYITAVNAGPPTADPKGRSSRLPPRRPRFDAQQKVYDSRKETVSTRCSGRGGDPGHRRSRSASGPASQSEQAQKQLADLRRIGQEQGLKAAQGTRESAQGRMPQRRSATQLFGNSQPHRRAS